jgi:excisionase family DNA binding protein
MPDNITPLAVSPRTAAQMLGFGRTHLFKLLKTGELKSYRDGSKRSKRRVLVKSIQEYVERRLEVDSKPAPGRPKKVASS